MRPFHALGTTTLLFTLALTCAAARATSPRPPSTLPDALSDFVTLLEKDDAKAASQRWARDAEAEKALTQYWPQLKQCHKDHNYRTWLDKAKTAEKETRDNASFTVGGHSYGHVHLVWQKSDAGWRVANVFMCR